MSNRLIVRLSVDYLVRWAKLMASYHGGDLLQALVAAATFQASTSHLDRAPASDGVAPPSGEPRSISVYAVAAALGQSRETVRRKVKRLAAEGLVIEHPKGIRVPEQALETPRVRETLAELARITREFQEGLTSLGADAPNRGPPLEPTAARAILARMTNGYCLRLVEDMSRISDGDLMRPLIFCAITVANTRHLPMTASAPHASFTPPLPDAARRPITALALSEELGLPRETTRRYLARVVDRGVCRRVRGGYIATEALFEREEAEPFLDRIAAHTSRFRRTLPNSCLDALLA